MFELTAVELVGYLASALIVTSLAMTSVVRLRTISLIGSITFLVYGGLIGSIPLILANASIAVINIWFLRAELGGHRDLHAVTVDPAAPFLVDFLEFHDEDIRRFQPEFQMPTHGAFAVIVSRDGLPAGVVIGRRQGDRLEIVLDHVLGAFRDSRIGTWLYGDGAEIFRRHGIRWLITSAGIDSHPRYLRRVGFHPEGNHLTLDLDRRRGKTDQKSHEER